MVIKLVLDISLPLLYDNPSCLCTLPLEVGKCTCMQINTTYKKYKHCTHASNELQIEAWQERQHRRFESGECKYFLSYLPLII